MNYKQHTPGPWRVAHNAKLGWAGILTQEGDVIADIRVDAMDFRDPEQAVGDAHLIAAAPDLLAALEAAHGYLVTFGTDHGDRVRSICMRAILKAQGKS